MDLMYRGEVLTLTTFLNNTVLWIKDLNQCSMPCMDFVGGYPNEFCVFLKKLPFTELFLITTMSRNNIVFYKNHVYEIKPLKNGIKLSGIDVSFNFCIYDYVLKKSFNCFIKKADDSEYNYETACKLFFELIDKHS